MGVEGAPKNGTQNKSEEKTKEREEAGGDGGACFTLSL